MSNLSLILWLDIFFIMKIKRPRIKKVSTDVRIFDKLRELHSDNRTVLQKYKTLMFNVEMKGSHLIDVTL